VLRYWPFGVVWCRAWLAIDVWLCTASIFNLCAISLDRYLAISRPIKYPTVMSPFRARLLIVTVWILSFVICFPPLLGNWNDGQQQQQLPTDQHPPPALIDADHDVMSDVILLQNAAMFAVNDSIVASSVPSSLDDYAGYSRTGDRRADSVKFPAYQVDDNDVGLVPGLPNCALTSDPGYVIYSACGSFWVPMLGMVIFYGKIYKTAVAATQAMKRGFIEKRTTGSSAGGLSNSASENALCTLRIHRGGSAVGSMARHSNGCISELLPRPSADVLLLQRTGSATGRRSVDGRLMSMRSSERQSGTATSEFIGRPSKPAAPTARPDVMSQPLPKIVITASLSCADDVTAAERSKSESQTDQPQQSSQQQEPARANGCGVAVGNGGEGDQPTKTSRKLGFLKKTSRCDAKLATDTSGLGDGASRSSTSGINGNGSGMKRKSSFLGLLDADGNANGDATGGGAAGGKRTSIQLMAARFAKLHIISQLRSLNKEKRAAKTVGIIVGCFIVCWAPFFTVYLAEAFCAQCTPTVVFQVFFWLGYCNSALNPFIYGLCSRDFRYAFRKFLRCGCVTGRWHSTGGGLMRQTNGQVMGMLQTMTMQIVARAATAAAASATAT
jgi:hypothetical protein